MTLLPSATLKRYASLICVNILIFLALLVLLEGISSYLLFLRDVSKTGALAERRYTEYDAELGWASVPNVDIPNLYGPGIGVTINSRGFRNDRELTLAVPDGRRRIICSGDSFTFGFGVSNDAAWCQLLSSRDPSVESVNMGQGGYGLDQSYLWFRRTEATLDYDIHIVAFIGLDFDRMRSVRFHGYPKPTLAVEDGELVTRNVPVPRLAYNLPLVTVNLTNLQELRTYQLLQGLLVKLGAAEPPSDSPSTAALRSIARKVFEELKTVADRRSTALMLVYLPTPADLVAGASTDWLEFVANTAADLGIPFINLVESFGALSFEEASALYIQRGEIDYPGAAGHLNESGNKIVAEHIRARLKDSDMIP